MTPVVHRRSIFGRGVVCGERWPPTQKTSKKSAHITCPTCLARNAAFQKSAKARAKLHGVG